MYLDNYIYIIIIIMHADTSTQLVVLMTAAKGVYSNVLAIIILMTNIHNRFIL